MKKPTRLIMTACHDSSLPSGDCKPFRQTADASTITRRLIIHLERLGIESASIRYCENEDPSVELKFRFKRGIHSFVSCYSKSTRLNMLAIVKALSETNDFDLVFGDVQVGGRVVYNSRDCSRRARKLI